MSLIHVAKIAFLILGIYIAHTRIKYHLNLLWFLSLWGFFQLSGHLVHVPESWPTLADCTALVSLWLVPHYVHFGHLLHFYGFAILTWLSWQTLCHIIHSRYQRRLMPTLGLLILCWTSSMGYGALCEVAEFVSSQILPSCYASNTPSTSSDLIANLLGASLATFFIKIRNI